MKFGCCISVKHVSDAKRFGYDFAELSALEIMSLSQEQWEKWKAHIHAVGLPIIGFNSFCDGRIALVGEKVSMRQNKAYLETLLQRARELGCHNIGIGAPKTRQLSSEFPYAKAQAQMQAFLRMASEMAMTDHISILYEALHPYSCNFANHTQEVYDTVCALQLSNLHIVWDVYHALLSGESFAQAQACMEQVRHIHVCGWDEQRNRYYLQEHDRPLLKELFTFLKKQQYDGSISIEAPDTSFAKIGGASLRLLQETYNEVCL